MAVTTQKFRRVTGLEYCKVLPPEGGSYQTELDTSPVDPRRRRSTITGSDPLYALESTMSRVRVLVGTRKGAFVLEADGKRQNWDVSGPFFGGWEMYHVKG